LSKTGKVKVWARINFDFDAHSMARIWAQIRIRHELGSALTKKPASAVQIMNFGSRDPLRTSYVFL
jgi:hypothetical protein